MPVLWLAVFPSHVSYRHRVNASRRRRHDNFSDAAEDIAALPEQVASAAGGTRVLIGLLNVGHGQTYAGVLTPWSALAWSAFEENQHPKDAFTLHVQGVFRFNVPRVVSEFVDGQGMITANPRFKQPLFLPYLNDVDGVPLLDIAGMVHNHATTLREVTAHWCPDLVSDIGFTVQVPALALAWPRAHRLLCGDESCVFAMARWMRFFAVAFVRAIGFPSEEWIHDHSCHHEEPADVATLSADSVQGFLHDVRSLWHRLLPSISSEDCACPFLQNGMWS